jgi:hypothetical protein
MALRMATARVFLTRIKPGIIRPPARTAVPDLPVLMAH